MQYPEGQLWTWDSEGQDYIPQASRQQELDSRQLRTLSKEALGLTTQNNRQGGNNRFSQAKESSPPNTCLEQWQNFSFSFNSDFLLVYAETQTTDSKQWLRLSQ